MSEHTEPYYSRHKVFELTCPHCKAMLTFLVNEKQHSVHACLCGRWLREIKWGIELSEATVWTYEPKAEPLTDTIV